MAHGASHLLQMRRSQVVSMELPICRMCVTREWSEQKATLTLHRLRHNNLQTTDTWSWLLREIFGRIELVRPTELHPKLFLSELADAHKQDRRNTSQHEAQ
mmetsp:Transcript_2736/g.4609  ORF Transcript_2736/g.4609 Transcript_2736/m.4609 type:complete len:101 (-) Transcript_2736:3515-3817(-)